MVTLYSRSSSGQPPRDAAPPTQEEPGHHVFHRTHRQTQESQAQDVHTQEKI